MNQDGETGGEVKDFSGNAPNGKVKGNVRWVEGVSGKAAYFIKGQ